MSVSAENYLTRFRRAEIDSFVKTLLLASAITTLLTIFALFPSELLDPAYLFVVLMGVFVVPRITLIAPRSEFAFNFSDSLTLLTFLIFGGPAAIVLAALQSLSDCLHLRAKGFSINRRLVVTNVSVSLLSTTVSYLVVLNLSSTIPSDVGSLTTQQLVLVLGCLAFLQFFVFSVSASLLHSLRTGGSFWQIWKKDTFSSAMTQIVGAGLAGLAYKLINYGSVVTAAIAGGGVIIAYLSYRQSINEINKAIDQVEDAERQKAGLERERRIEAEHHFEALTASLAKEEAANAALRKSEKDFQHAALHDSLTSLANRKHLGDILREQINAYKCDSSAVFQVLFLDIRSFKNINDSLGHTIGDKVLEIAAKRFVRVVNDTDTVARIGGDEFAIILRGVDSPGKAQRVARKIYQNITQPFALGGNTISIDVNIGIAPADVEYNVPEEILRDADIAMHYAKETKKGLAYFTKELRTRFLERVRLEMDLRHAVERGELSLHYQPIISISDGRLIGFEALLRWNHAELGMIPPNRFIPIAEESGLIQSLTVWILHETTNQLKAWQAISPDYRDLMVSVNISGKHLSNNDLIDDVLNVINATRIRPESLKLEITESTAMVNAEHTINVLNQLKKIGVMLSIDDFGTGYSSLSYLHRLPFDTLKIDRSFVCNVGEHGENSQILQTIISLAKNLKIRVIAEGIETESQLAVLQNLGCDYGQGFLLAKPKNKVETEKLLYQSPNWLPFGHRDDFQTSSLTSDVDNLPVF